MPIERLGKFYRTSWWKATVPRSLLRIYPLLNLHPLASPLR